MGSCLDGPSVPKEGPQLSIVLPAFNEESVLAGVLTEVTSAFPQAEVILVSDGSTDATPKIAESFAPRVRTIHYEPNRGKGYAIRTGMALAEGEFCIFTDADLPFGTQGVAEVYDCLRNNPDLDIVIASKIHVRRGWLYRFARSIARLGIALLTGLRYADTQAGLKGFRREVAKRLYGRARMDGFASDIEILYLARREGLRVGVIPMAVASKDVRPSSFTFVAGARLLRDVLRIRYGR